MNPIKSFLEYKAYCMRLSALGMTSKAGSGHPTSALSAADIIAALFFYAMKFDPRNPDNPNNDRFIISKGHASPIFYAVWKELGILTEQELLTYRQFDSVLEGHPTSRFIWTEAATGSLGMGLSIGAGMALSARIDKRSFFTYVLLGDSEVAEGQIWEAAEIAAFYKLHNLVAILDGNRLGQSCPTMHEHHMNRYAAKFESFGWKTVIIDGHDMQQIMGALDKARSPADHPTIIIAKTIKGYGVAQAEDKEGFHGKAFSSSELETIEKQLANRFSAAAHFDPEVFHWHPQIPENNGDDSTQDHAGEMQSPHYTIQDQIATRKAYGQAVAHVGRSKSVVCLDAEVKNSTYAELFEEKFPERFIQCFIAEQNMVSMAVGLQKRGKIPFVSTFGAFFSRAHDQIRMAAIGNAALRLCGSHAGISIGEDGPSQMALEDIAILRAIPQSIIYYPSDAVSCYKLVALMLHYDRGISYLRTTRMATPQLYDNQEEFTLGGCKVVRSSDQDVAVVIGAGITVHQALRAYEQLALEGISITVIDLYCIKPIDSATIIKSAHAAGKKVIVVEDHYMQGGIGEAVTYELRNTDIKIHCLAVTQLPRSGTPQELMAWAGIDAAAIVKAVKSTMVA